MTTGKPRGLWITGNWKMNHGPLATKAFFQDIKSTWRSCAGLHSVLFIPSISLSAGVEYVRAAGLECSIGAQNIHWEPSGAFTGELSAPLLKEIGIDWALVGHSERRQFFGETNESAGKRTLAALKANMQVMLCIGETKAERQAEKTFEVLKAQLDGGLLQDCAPYLDGRLLLAYEPVWAIGTGLTASPDQAEEAHKNIRDYLWKRFGIEAAGRTPILYGGSVTPQNAKEIFSKPNVDGGLIGGASLKTDSFLALRMIGESVV